MKTPISTSTSINVDQRDEKINIVGDKGLDPSAQLLENTGIIKDGGVLNLYEKENLFSSSGQRIIATDGSLLSATLNGDTYTVMDDDAIIGSVSAWGVEKRSMYSGFDDPAASADGTLLACRISADTVTLYEYDSDNNLLNERSTQFAALTGLSNLYTSISFARYDNMHFEDPQDYCLRMGNQVLILQESNPSVQIISGFQSSTMLGAGNAVRCSTIYNGMLVVAGDNGRIASYDGSNWKNYDGTGSGKGPFDNGTAVGTTSRVRCMIVYNGSLVVAGDSGHVGSWDGTAWHLYSSSGTGLWHSGTAFASNNITCVTIINNALWFGAGAGYVVTYSAGSWATQDSGSALGNVAVQTIALGDNPYTILVAGDSGRAGVISIGVSGSGVIAVTGGTASGYNRFNNCMANGTTVVALSLYDSNNYWTYNVSTNNGASYSGPTYFPGSVAKTSLLCYGYVGSKFMAVFSTSTNPIVYTSSDGSTWASQTLSTWSTTNVPRGIGYNNGTYIMVGNNTTLVNTAYQMVYATSSTGLNFSGPASISGVSVKSPTRISQSSVMLAGKNSWTIPYFVGQTTIKGSAYDTCFTRLLQWSPSAGFTVSNCGYDASINDMYIAGDGDQKMWILGYDGYNMMRTLDGGATWTACPIASPAIPYQNSTTIQPSFNRVLYLAGQVVLTGYYGAIVSSTDGDRWSQPMVFTTWSGTTPTYTMGNMSDWAATSDRIVGVGNNGASTGATCAAVFMVFSWKVLTYLSQQNIAGGYIVNGGHTGMGFTPLTTQKYNGINVFSGSSGKSAIVSQTALPIRSAGGMIGSSGTPFPGNPTVNAIDNNGSTIIAVGSGKVSSYSQYGTVHRSTDSGQTWTTSYAPGCMGNGSTYYSAGPMYGVKYCGNNVWIITSSTSIGPTYASGTQGTLSISTDNGVTWSSPRQIPGVVTGSSWTIAQSLTINTYDGTNIVALGGYQVNGTGTAGDYAFYSNNGGVSWGSFKLADWVTNNGFPLSSVQGPNGFSMVLGHPSDSSCYAISNNYGQSYGSVQHIPGWPATSSNTTYFNQMSCVRRSSNGTIIVIGGSGGISGGTGGMVARTVNNGASWTNVSQAIAGVGYQCVSGLSTDGNGTWVATYGGTSGSGSNPIGAYTYSTDDGVTWSRLCSTGCNTMMRLSSYGYTIGQGSPIWDGSKWHLFDGFLNRFTFETSANSYGWVPAGSPQVGTFVSPPANNIILSAPAVGSQDIVSSTIYNNEYVVGSSSGRVANFSSSGWSNYDGSTPSANPGIPVYNSGSVVNGYSMPTMLPYQNKLTVGSTNGVIAFINSDNTTSKFYTAVGTGQLYTSLLDGFGASSIYCYKYENGMYLINLVGNNLNKSYVLNNTTFDVGVLACKFAIPQVKNGKTRHILTGDPSIGSSQLNGTSMVGYTDFSNFSQVQVYPSIPLSVSSILTKQSGWGYEEFTFKQTSSATNVFSYLSPQTLTTAGSPATIVQSNTDTMVDFYGKLTNNMGVTPSVPFEIRALVSRGTSTPGVPGSNGLQVGLSAALLDSSLNDALGVMITLNGEMDNSWTPHVVNDSTILYKYNSKWFLVKMSKNGQLFQKMSSPTLYKLNTISPFNVYDTVSKTLNLGSIDYNGRMIYTSQAAPTTPLNHVVSVITSKYDNSIDQGEKLIQIPTPTSANFEIIGYRIPNATGVLPGYEVDVYYSPTAGAAPSYKYSTHEDGSEFENPDKSGIVYVQDNRDSVAIGYHYDSNTVTTNTSTIFLNPEYDGFVQGNNILGVFTPFMLFGLNYLVDGTYIYQAQLGQVQYTDILGNTVFNETYSRRDIVTESLGCRLIGVSPTKAFFYSDFDSSIYTFDGQRDLVKAQVFSKFPNIIDGRWSVRDNLLVMQTSSEYLWMRDGIVSRNAKKPTQAGTSLYDTANGLIICNNNGMWNYTYRKQAGSTVVPLVWKSGYFGMGAKEKCILSEVAYTLYSENREALNITTIVDSFDQDKSYTEKKVKRVVPSMYNSNGYVHLSLKPKNQTALAFALTLQCDARIELFEVTADVRDEGDAVISLNNSI